MNARGVLVSGVPGCGKSSFARCLGQATGRPVLNLDIGGLYQSLVGETERALREALKRIDAVGNIQRPVRADRRLLFLFEGSPKQRYAYPGTQSLGAGFGYTSMDCHAVALDGRGHGRFGVIAQ